MLKVPPSCLSTLLEAPKPSCSVGWGLVLGGFNAVSPSKQNSTVAGAPGVTPSGKDNFSKDSPSVGKTVNSFTHKRWSLKHLHRGIPPGDLQAPNLEDAVLD